MGAGAVGCYYGFKLARADAFGRYFTSNPDLPYRLK
jgi:hypothetical protein